MKKECESIFIELVSPYLTALAAARSLKRDDWHGVFNYANVLKSEVTDVLNESNIKVDISALGAELADIASVRLHAREGQPGARSAFEAMTKIGEIQNKLRQVLIDSVCACESGPKIVAYQVGKFPVQDRTLMTLRNLAGGYKIKQIHDDGDLTVEARDTLYVVTTDGNIFEEVKEA